MKMFYDYQYDVASLIAVSFLLVVCILRRSYKTKSNVLFQILIICDLLGSSFDIASCVCISNPDKIPVVWGYFTALGYLFFYNCMGILFFMYIDSRTKLVWMWTPAKIIGIGSIIAEGILIGTSPWTHLVSYFDEQMVYQHGSLMTLLYVIAALMLFMSAVMFIFARRRFNRYQVFAICAFIIAVFVGVLIQAVLPRVLVGQFGCTLVLFFIYVALENPAYYTYKATPCLNRNSFLYTLKKNHLMKKNLSLVLFCIKDFDQLKRGLLLTDQERLSSSVADWLGRTYGKQGYCLDDDKFAVVLTEDWKQENVICQLKRHFDHPVPLMNSELLISIFPIYVESVMHEYDTDDIEDALNYLLSEQKLQYVNQEALTKTIEKQRRNIAISHEIKEFIAQDKFEVFYQPIRNVKRNTFSSVEALIRMRSEKLGFISPEEFIPIAEKENLICEIGEIVFRKVCQFMSESQCHKFGVDYVEINLSPIQCYQENLFRHFTSIMGEFSVRPDRINLEITETASFEDSQVMKDNIEQFSEMGVSFSLDDYGSGFASIDYLFKLPVDIVKIDKGILWQAMKDSNAMIVLERTIEMLRCLGKKIVVEGVENEDMVNTLESFGCDYMQGYYYSKPICAGEYVSFLKKHQDLTVV